MHANKCARPYLLLLPIFCASILPAQYQSQPGQYDQNDPPASIARLGYLQGNVLLQPSGSDDWSQAPPNYPLIGGDRLYTGPRDRAVVQLAGAELRLWQATDVTLTNVTDQFQQIGLAAGTFRLRVFEMDPGSQIEVDTPNGTAIVETPGDYRFEAFPQTSAQDSSSIVTINAGNAQITGPGINQPVSGGYSIGLFGANPVQLQYLDVPDYDDLDQWSISLDQRLQNSVSARYVSRQMVGYGDLDDYGTWNPNTEYGPGWFPNQVPYGWQPYSTGHWAYIQPWGYTWVDDAPWGFAPFHYGRWSQIDGRWGWFPGPPAVRPVYSPALVAFVGGGPGGEGGGISVGISFGGGVGISAWFPIGVGEPYVPWYRCSPRYAQQVNSTNVNLSVIRNTTIVNNYNTYINKTVINNTTINNTTVNNTTINNFNYANHAQVTAVPATAMASGASVSRQAVRLSPQQQQEIARAPIAIRPTAPVPATPHPSLVRAANVTRPAARPTLMTPAGEARAVPSAAQPHPVVISRLPPPRVVPKNAAPPPASPRPAGPNRPNAPVPVAAPERPVPQPVAPTRPLAEPTAPLRQPAPAEPTRPAVEPKQAVAEPEPRSVPIPSAPMPPAPKPVVRPAQPRPVEPEPESRPAPEPPARPAPVVRPYAPPPASPPASPRQAPPAPVERPAPPQPAERPEPRPAPAPIEKSIPQQRPAPAPERPLPPAEARPPAKPEQKSETKPEERSEPKDEQKEHQ